MAEVPDVVLDLYNGIPKDCFVAGVPFTLRGFEDNEVIPSFDAVPGPDGVPSKWIRFCDYLPFVDACKAYWMGLLHSKHPVYVYVMPYTPLRDGYYLHDLIDDAAELPNPDSFSEDEPVDLDQEIGAEAPQLKQGRVEVDDGVKFSFFVVNYSLLYAKACRYRVLSFVSDPLRECQRRLDISENLLRASAPGGTFEQLVSFADDARRRLALVLMDRYTDGVLGIDLHDSLLAMYPDIHNQVYQEQCKCHHPNPVDLEEPSFERIESVMLGLGYEESEDDELSIRQTEKNLLNSEGAVEFHNCSTNAHAQFSGYQKHVCHCHHSYNRLCYSGNDQPLSYGSARSV